MKNEDFAKLVKLAGEMDTKIRLKFDGVYIETVEGWLEDLKEVINNNMQGKFIVEVKK